MNAYLLTEPYCGPAPEPGFLLSAWNFDPLPLAFAAALLVAYSRRRPDAASLRGGAAFWPGLAILLLLFLSPLCALTTALFSARVAHHVLLVAVAAPLVALAFPARRGQGGPLALLVGLHALVFWVWHLPQAYAFGIAGAIPYWAMQASLFLTALFMWRALLAAPPGAALLALLAAIIQMGMLGALLTFAGRPLFEPHLATTIPFGLTPLQDQQLGGLVMWVPALAPYIWAAVRPLMRLLDGGRIAAR